MMQKKKKDVPPYIADLKNHAKHPEEGFDDSHVLLVRRYVQALMVFVQTRAYLKQARRVQECGKLCAQMAQDHYRQQTAVDPPPEHIRVLPHFCHAKRDSTNIQPTGAAIRN